MLGPPSPPSSPSLSRRRRSWARRCERYCCNLVTYFPLAFVYGLTSWAVWVEAGIGFLPVTGVWTGYISSAIGILLYVLLNWSYTTAVFTDPGSPLNTKYGYSHLPSSEPHAYTSFTVKSTGDIRFCKKCQTKKPDRAHHCSTCRRCVLKMDHHCPWLATCVGLRNYKPFLLFLIYTSLFCWICFAVTATWLWSEVLSDGQFQETLMPVNYILLAVLSGIIGLVLTGFTAWHIYLACKGRTTIESLEKTRYLSPLRKSMQQQLNNRNYIDQGRPSFSEQLREIHANALPGVTRPEEGEERPSPAHDSLRRNWNDIERQRERDRYNDYLDEQDSEKLPNAFDLGWRRNLLHVFGENRWLWFLPICNTIGDGWQWEPSPKWLQAREDIAREREAQTRVQKERERVAGWGVSSEGNTSSLGTMPARPRYVEWGDRDGADNRYLMTSNGLTTVPSSGRRSPGKADQVLGRSPGSYYDGGPGSPGLPGSATRMRTLDRRQPDVGDAHDDADEYDVSSDEELADRRASLQQKQGGKSDATANWNDVPEDLLAGSRRGQIARAKSSSRSREPSRNRRRANDEWQEWGPG